MRRTARPHDPSGEAIRLLKDLQIIKPPIPVEKVARHIQAEVRFSPLDDEISGMVFVKKGVPVIGVNSMHHPNRQRFTIAHEIGHLILHRDIVESSVHVDKEYRVLMRDPNASRGIHKIEIAANQFAAELLMPRSLLEPMLQGKVFDLDDETWLETLSRRFRVSKQAMSHRLNTFLLFA